jgi:hypothetical protein
VGIHDEHRRDISFFCDAPFDSVNFSHSTKAYTNRAFDIMLDPTVGMRRVFWPKNFKTGLSFANPAHSPHSGT